MKANNDKILLGLAGGAFAYFGVIEPLLQSINVIDTPEEKAEEQSIKKGGGSQTGSPEANPWNPEFVQSLIRQSGAGGYYTKLLTVAALDKFSESLYDAKGSLFSSKPFWNDDEELVYSVFRSMVSKSQLSQLSGHFIKTYQADLWYFLTTFLNEKELSKITDMVNGYKIGKIKNNILT